MSEWSAGLTLLLCAACRAFGNYDGTDTGNDSAYSNIALELHTDGAYMRDPPALQLWTCMYTASDGGGVSRYVDGLRVAERLQQTDPAAYDSSAAHFAAKKQI
jgi:Probable taurine catabolism dioxygenase